MTWGSPPLAVFADELAEGRAYLAEALTRPALAGRPELSAGVDVGLFLPPDYAPSTATPFVRLTRDGTPDAVYPVVAYRTLRVVVWHRSTTHAKALAELCLALLLTHPGGDRLKGCLYLTGVTPGTDPDNDGDLASFTVRARVGATVL